MKLRHKILCHGFGAFAIVKTAILLFGFFAGIHGIGGVNAEGETIPEWSGFLDSGFWNKYNSNYTYDGITNRTNYGTSDLVEALYGTSSVYVQNWTGYTEDTCTGMTVVETPTLPQYLDGNTIYVLTEDFNAVFGDENKTSLSVNKGCSAIVSSGMFKIYLSEELNDKNKGVVSVLSGNFILDNIKIEGTGQRVNYGLYIKSYYFTLNELDVYGFTENSEYTADSAGVFCENGSYGLLLNIKSHLNDKGMIISNSSYLHILDCDLSHNKKLGLNGSFSNSRFSNSVVHDNKGLGLFLEGGSNNSFDNLQIYGVIGDTDLSAAGFRIKNSTENILSNLLIYNMNTYGVSIESKKNVLNNVEIFNIDGGRTSPKDGIKVASDSNVFNNIFIYNVKGNGIAISEKNEKNVFNNVWVFNTQKGISDSNDDAEHQYLNYYCSGLYLFGNTLSGVLPYFSGDCNSFSGGLLSNGSLYVDNNTISWDYITNPLQKTKDRIKSGYMLNWGSGFSDIRGYVSNYTGETIKYSFGIKTPLQVQPLMWSGNEIVEAKFLSYNSGMYIGATDNTVYATGEISYLDSSKINVITGSDLITHYSVFGESNAWIFDQPIGEPADLTWNINTGNLNGKRLVVQLTNPSTGYLATHFQKNLHVPGCLQGWNNDNFLDSEFRNNYSGNNEMGRQQVICALYGKDQTDKTAYTIGWSGWDTTQCSGVDMTVIETGTLPDYLDENTIYVLTTGKVSHDTINMANCSAIVSKSGSVLYTGNIILDGKQYSILDNIAVNNMDSDSGKKGILLSGGNNNTLNNIQSYNNGIGLRLSASNNNILNNIQSYNNGMDGIYLYYSIYNTLNNIHTYNVPGYGIIVHNSSNNVLNNVQNYNNYSEYGNCGIYLNGSNNNILNDVRSYNNRYGIYLSGSSSNSYYGALNLFENDDNSLPNGLSSGSSNNELISGLGRSDGAYKADGTLTWNLFTNPVDIDGHYLLDWSTGFNNLRGTGIIGEISGYSYGVDIKAQAQPVVWSGDTLIRGGSYDQNYYIGSNVKIATGTLEYNQTNAEGTQTVTGTSDYGFITQYTVFGDVEDTGYVTKGSGLTITYTGDKEVKLLITQLKGNTPLTFASHFQSSASSVSCSIEMVEDQACTSGQIQLRVVVTSGSVSGYVIYKDGAETGLSGNFNGNNKTGEVWVSETGTYTGAVVKDGNKIPCGQTPVVVTNDVLDKEGPTTGEDTVLEFTGYECTTITGFIDTGTLIDPGCSSGLEESVIGIRWSGYNSDFVLNTGFMSGSETLFSIPVIFTDFLGNSKEYSVNFVWLNSEITANDFTGSDNVGSGSVTVNWKTGSNASDGACGSGTVTFSGFISTGSHGVCTTGDADTIIYTPNQGQTGEDYCEIEIKDDELSTTGVKIYLGGIDTKGPVVTLSGGNNACTNVTGRDITTTIDGVETGISYSLFSGENVEIPSCLTSGSKGNCVEYNTSDGGLKVILIGGTGRIWLDTGVMDDEWLNGNDYVEIVVGNYDGTGLDEPVLISPSNNSGFANSGVTFKWSGVLEDGCAGVSGYILRYWTGENSGDAVEISLDSGKTTYETGLTIAGGYSWMVTAVDNFGRETDSEIYNFTFNPDTPICTISQSACTTGDVLLTLSWEGDDIIIIDSGGVDWEQNDSKTWSGTTGNNGLLTVIIESTGFSTTGSCYIKVTGHDVDAPVINSMTTGVYECTDLNFVVEAEDEGCAGISGYLFSGTLFGAINTGNSRFTLGSESVGRTGGVIDMDITVYDTLGNQVTSGVSIEIWNIKPEIGQQNIDLGVLTGNFEMSLSEIMSGFKATEGACGTGDLLLEIDGDSNTCEITGDNLYITIDGSNGGECIIKISDNEGSFVTGKITYGADTNIPGILLIGTNLACMSTNTFTVTGTFTENVNGFELGDIEVENGSGSYFGGNGAIYAWQVNMTPMEEVSVKVPMGVANNTNGNPNTGSNILTGMYDNVGPNDVTFANWKDTGYATYATLNWDATIDSGCAGVSGYNYKFVNGSNCNNNIIYNGFKSDTSLDVNGLNHGGTYSLCVQSVDNFGNVGQWISKTFTVNLNSIGCEINESACSNTGVVLTLSPSQGILGAYLSWTGYGQESDINKVVTSFGEIVTGYIWQNSEQGLKQAICTYSVKNIDKREPIVNQLSPVSVPECTTGTATITATDQGCGSGGLMYNWNGLGFGADTSYSLYSGNAGSKNVNVQVRDGALNITGIIVIFEWINSPISGHNFTGSENVGNTPKTANWKILSEVSDGLCGNATISYSGIVVPGQHGTCTVNGDIITYTPNTGIEYEGGDSCIIQIKDDENSTMNITVYWGGIDTKAPSITVNNASGYECEWISGSIGLNSVNKETGVSYRWNNETIFVTGENSYHQINYTVGIRNIPVVVRDIYGNEITTGVTYRWNDTGVTLSVNTVHGPTITASQTVQQGIFTLFGAREGNCEITNLSAKVLSCTGGISSMIIDGNTRYTVTPVELYEGQGQCTIVFTDDDNNSATGTIVFGVHTGKPSPYLTISVDKTLVNVDENVKYTVCYGNTGNATGINVDITVDLPSLFNGNVNSWTSNGGQYNSMFHSVSWMLPTLAPNQTGCFNYFVGKYSKEGFYVTVATLTGKNVSPALVSSATVEVVARPYCGDGIVGDNEVCDDGKNNGKKGYCNEDCDGYVERTDNDKQGVACKYSDENYLSRGVFTDTYGHWGFNYIENMRLSCLHRGKMTFAGLWQYRPDDSTTRAEVIKTLVKIRGIQKDDFDINTEDAIYPGAQLFVDVPRNHWFAWYSEYAYNNGLMDELYATVGGQRYFVPEGVISRNEIIKKVMILYNELNGVSSIDSKISGSSRLTDVASSSPYYKYIREAESLGIISGVDNLAGGNQWQGSRSLTRAEFAKIVSNAFSDILFED